MGSSARPVGEWKRELSCRKPQQFLSVWDI